HSLSLHDALPILDPGTTRFRRRRRPGVDARQLPAHLRPAPRQHVPGEGVLLDQLVDGVWRVATPSRINLTAASFQRSRKAGSSAPSGGALIAMSDSRPR